MKIATSSVARAKLVAWMVGHWIGILILLALQMNTARKRRYWSVWFRTVGVAAVVGGTTSVVLHSHPPWGWWAFACGIILTWIGGFILSRQDNHDDQGG
ncbi:MAG: hypothetical protein EPN36_14485 [Rhodanobacteraceae bacterium]|nr:MAG: hypothetical protein EPN36_14485 [Rhodanobacteraceae bacterium]